MCASCVGSRAAVAEALAAAGRMVVTTHIRPDADAIGSAAALRLSATAAGRHCRVVIPDAVPQRYTFLSGDDPPGGPADFAALAAEADRVVVVDTCTFMQLDPLAEALRPLRGKTVVIDHHATADDVAAVIWRDPSAAAAGVMVAELLEALDWPIPLPAGEALAAAIYTDTGWLRHPNTDARALGVITRLLEIGVRPGALYAKLYQSDRPERLGLLAAALASLELHAGGRVATVALTGADFDRTGAARDETEDFVNEPMRIGSVEASAMLVEQPGGEVRVSLRGKGAVDVAALARTFGGGGHTQAAGCTVAGDIASVRRLVVAACAAALRARPS